MTRKRNVHNIIAALTFTFALFGDVKAALAAPIGFAVDLDSNLYVIDLGGGTAVLVGATGVFLEAIALSPTGDLFGTDTSGRLYSIDTTTGLATLIGGTDRGNIEALDFLGSTLVGVDFAVTPTAFSIDTTTAATTDIVTATTSTGLVRAGALLDGNTMLIRGDDGCVSSTSGQNCLWSLNLVTGVPTSLGDIETGADNLVTGLDFASDGLFYGLDSSGQLFVVDPTTAAVSGIVDLGDQFWLGFTTAAVPEPATLGLIGLAISAAAWRRRRSRVSS